VRFPEDFMVQLVDVEFINLKIHSGISSRGSGFPLRTPHSEFHTASPRPLDPKEFGVCFLS